MNPSRNAFRVILAVGDIIHGFINNDYDAAIQCHLLSVML
jgi:hypothetical protein